MKLKNKIVLAFVAIACVSFMSISAFAAATVELTPSTTTVAPGGEFTVDVTLADNPGHIALQLNVTAQDGFAELTAMPTDYNIIAPQMFDTTYAKNPYVLSWGNMMSTTDYTGNGKIATLSYKVREDIEPGDYKISITPGGNCMNASFGMVEVGTDEITITVKAAELEAPVVSVDGKQEAYTDDSGKFTQGFLATTDVTGKAPISAITFNLTRTSDDATDTITATLPAKVENGTVKVAINIINVTSGVEITATGTAVKAAN